MNVIPTCNPSAISLRHNSCFPISSVLYDSSLIVLLGSGPMTSALVAPIDCTRHVSLPCEPGTGTVSEKPISSNRMTTVPVEE